MGKRNSGTREQVMWRREETRDKVNVKGLVKDEVKLIRYKRQRMEKRSSGTRE